MKRLCTLLLLLALVSWPAQDAAAMLPNANTYYVSSSSGNDAYPGTQAQPFKTVAKVNSLQSSLKAGDHVLFKCGDTWRGELLTLTKSGTSGSPITYSSYPTACANQPILSGTQPITGWTVYSGHIYVATLTAGANAGLFPNGINQLFRDGKRQLLGRWPNLNAGDGGYATVDAQSDSTHITDSQLPAVNWAGATLHLKVIRWSMVNRNITARSGTTLTLATGNPEYNATTCPYTTNCSGWGYFINNSLNTLDQDGEWYYDKTAHKVYYYSLDNPSTHTIEGSVIPANASNNLGAINLGAQAGSPLNYLVVDNFKIIGWYKHGIAAPTNLTPNESTYLTLQNNQIFDVDADGINLWTWVFGSANDDWRGGNYISILNNTISGANHFGIHTPSRNTTIEGNTIRDIALIENLNESGMGCGTDGSEGTCTEDGAGLRIYYSADQGLSGYGFTIRYNRFERIGGNGVMNFGHTTTIRNNVFRDTCYAKGDCGAINTFGGNSLASSPVHDITIDANLILDTHGNTDGTHPDFRAPFGFGLYIDNYSRAVTSTANTVAGSTSHGILYQRSSGTIQNNTVFNNVTGSMWGAQTALSDSAAISNFSSNVLVSNNAHSYDLSLVSSGQIAAASNNQYASSKMSNVVSVGSAGKTFAQWKTLSDKESGSSVTTGAIVDQYFLIYNDTRTDKSYNFSTWPTCNLNGVVISGPLTLTPYTSRVVYRCGVASNRVNLPMVVK
jgi:hypothetical protein